MTDQTDSAEVEAVALGMLLMRAKTMAKHAGVMVPSDKFLRSVLVVTDEDRDSARAAIQALDEYRKGK